LDESLPGNGTLVRGQHDVGVSAGVPMVGSKKEEGRKGSRKQKKSKPGVGGGGKWGPALVKEKAGTSLPLDKKSQTTKEIK